MKNLIYLFVLLISAGFGLIACNSGNDHAADQANIRKAYDALSKKDFATFVNKI